MFLGKKKATQKGEPENLNGRLRMRRQKNAQQAREQPPPRPSNPLVFTARRRGRRGEGEERRPGLPELGEAEEKEGRREEEGIHPRRGVGRERERERDKREKEQRSEGDVLETVQLLTLATTTKKKKTIIFCCCYTLAPPPQNTPTPRGSPPPPLSVPDAMRRLLAISLSLWALTRLLLLLLDPWTWYDACITSP